jgi:colanic acid biosynthesis glycosyl transferase WcaI
MRILIVGLNFYPELTGVGKYTSDMARWLVARGHDVRVIASPPFYPEWRFPPGYSRYFWHRDEWSGVRIVRCPIWLPKKITGLSRIFHLLSYAFSIIPALMAHIFWKPDIVWTVEPPLLLSPSVLFFSFITKASSVLHIQDFEVDAAFNLGLIRGLRLKRFALSVEKFILRRFDLVSTISSRMLALSIIKGVSPNRAIYFPNWVDLNFDCDKSLVNYRVMFNIPSDGIIVLYSGNMGAKQGIEILSDLVVRVAEIQNLENKINFIFCGSGIAKDQLVDSCKDFDFVHFLQLQSDENFPILLGSADIHILPQRSDAADLVMPSKLTGMLASGKSILVTALPNTELGNVLDGIAIIVPPDDVNALLDGVLTLANDFDLRKKLGRAGRLYAEHNLARDMVLVAYENQLQRLTDYSEA